MTYFPLRQTTCFFIPLVAPCKPLLATIDYNKRVRLEHAKENIAFEHAETQRMEA